MSIIGGINGSRVTTPMPGLTNLDCTSAIVASQGTLLGSVSQAMAGFGGFLVRTLFAPVQAFTAVLCQTSTPGDGINDPDADVTDNSNDDLATYIPGESTGSPANDNDGCGAFFLGLARFANQG